MKETTPSASPMMNTEEVAEYLSLHPLTVRRLARAGEMQGVGASGQGLTKTEMVKLLREGDVGGAAHVEGEEDSGPS